MLCGVLMSLWLRVALLPRYVEKVFLSSVVGTPLLKFSAHLFLSGWAFKASRRLYGFGLKPRWAVLSPSRAGLLLADCVFPGLDLKAALLIFTKKKCV